MVERCWVVMENLWALFLIINLTTPLAVFAKNFSVSPSVGLSSNRYAFNSQQNQSSLDFDAVASYVSSYGVNYGNYFAISKDFVGEEKWEVADGYFYASSSLGQLNEEIKVSGLARVIYPLSETSRKYDHLIGRLMIAPIFTSDLALVGAPFIGLTYRPSYTHSLYEYKVSLNGKSNPRSSIGNLFAVSIDAWSLFTLSSTLSYSVSWSQSGNQRPDSFTWAHEIAIPVSENSELSLAYENVAGAKDPSGTESNVKPFDDKTGVFSAAVSFNL